jgi:hypothetical protein
MKEKQRRIVFAFFLGDLCFKALLILIFIEIRRKRGVGVEL